MGLFDGKILKLGEALSEELRTRAATHHENAANLIAQGRNQAGVTASIKGDILDEMAEVIEKVTSGE